MQGLFCYPRGNRSPESFPDLFHRVIEATTIQKDFFIYSDSSLSRGCENVGNDRKCFEFHEISFHRSMCDLLWPNCGLLFSELYPRFPTAVITRFTQGSPQLFPQPFLFHPFDRSLPKSDESGRKTRSQSFCTSLSEYAKVRRSSGVFPFLMGRPPPEIARRREL